MELNKLKETLIELHEELNAAPAEIDQETQALLKQISSDINQLFPSGERQRAAELETDHQAGLIDRLMHLTDEFEESHPRLAEVIGRVATALSRIGI